MCGMWGGELPGNFLCGLQGAPVGGEMDWLLPKRHQCECEKLRQAGHCDTIKSPGVRGIGVTSSIHLSSGTPRAWASCLLAQAVGCIPFYSVQQTGSTDIYARSGLGLLGVGRVPR